MCIMCNHAPCAAAGATGNPSNDIQSILAEGGDLKWAAAAPIGTAAVVTYSFPTSALDYFDFFETSGFDSMSGGQKEHVRAALDVWAQEAGITFVEVPESVGGDIRFSMLDMTGFTASDGSQAAGYAYYPTSQAFPEEDISGDVFMNSNFYGSASSMAPGRAGFNVLLHEIGHAIGFKHPFEEGVTIDEDKDNGDYTIMSYNTFADQRTLGSVDKAALKYLYGTKSYEARWSDSYESVVTNATSDDDLIYGWRHNDFVRAENGDDTIFAGGGDDRIYSGKGDDTVYGGDGDDYVRAGGGREAFYGGSRTDYIDYIDSSHGVRLNLETNEASGSWAANDTINGFDGAGGSRTGDDVIYGTGDNNLIKTHGGDDVVVAGDGEDVVRTGDGDDLIRAGTGDDAFYGGAGVDTLSYYSDSTGVDVSLISGKGRGGEAKGDTYSSIENVSGSATGGDRISGSDKANLIKTYGGNDTVYSGRGNDEIHLGSGDDIVVAGGGRESFFGGSGDDLISYSRSSGGVRIDLRDDDVSRSWGANDSIKSFENATGSDGGDDVLLGTDDGNTLKGKGGDDRLYGRDGNDYLFGGDGADFFDGGNGADRLQGGAGADVFHFDKGEDNDRIYDFQNNVDTLQFDRFEDGFDPFAFATQVGDDVVFNLGGGDRVTVEDITLGQLSNDVEVV